MRAPRVLIIDDDPEWGKGSLRTPLLPLEYEVTTIDDRVKALEKVKNETFDLAILNVRLSFETKEAKIIPQWAELLDLIRQRNAEAIVVTSRSFPSSIQVDKLIRMAFKDFDVVDFLIKEDFNPKEYREIVQETIRRRLAPSPVTSLIDEKIPKGRNSDSSDSFWDVTVAGGHYYINEGVHRDIINSLRADSRLDALFVGITNYREALWAVMSRPQDDTAYSYAAHLWMELWAQEKGLPPFNMVRFLAQKEYSGDLYIGYRDHVVHSLLVYLLGLHIYYSNLRIQEAMTPIGGRSEFLKVWKIAALFHDIGYYLNFKDDKATAESQRLLLEQLQAFASNPLHAYGAVHKVFSLAGADEKEIRRQAENYPLWELSAITDLRKPVARAEGHILDVLDDLVRGANLADHSKGRYCYRYDKYAQDTDTDTYSRCDDHGMLSAMILLGQHTHFQRYVDATCKPEILERVTGLSSEAYEWLPRLPEIVRQYERSINQAAAAIALHNVHVTGWAKHDLDWSKARSEPYFLTLDQYKLSLSKTPLAWLLALTDVLQCWDRPSRTDAPLALEDCTMKHQEIRIMASSSEKIAVTFATDANRKVAASRFNKLVDEMGKYMQDLDLLEEG